MDKSRAIEKGDGIYFTICEQEGRGGPILTKFCNSGSPEKYSIHGYISDSIDGELAEKIAAGSTPWDSIRKYGRSTITSDSEFEEMKHLFRLKTGVSSHEFVNEFIRIGLSNGNYIRFSAKLFGYIFDNLTVGSVPDPWWHRVAGELNYKQLNAFYRGLVIAERMSPRGGSGSATPIGLVLSCVSQRICRLDYADLLDWTEENRVNNYTPFRSSTVSPKSVAEDVRRNVLMDWRIQRRKTFNEDTAVTLLSTCLILKTPLGTFRTSKTHDIRLLRERDVLRLAKEVEQRDQMEQDRVKRVLEEREAAAKRALESQQQERLRASHERGVTRERVIAEAASMPPNERIDYLLSQNEVKLHTLPPELFANLDKVDYDHIMKLNESIEHIKIKRWNKLKNNIARMVDKLGPALN